jgi:hypothetical protein
MASPDKVPQDETLVGQARRLERSGDRLAVLAARLRLLAAKWREKLGRRVQH